MCLRITEVLEFYTTQESDLKFFSASESGKYYVGSFSYEDGEVLILNPESFVEVVENDIEKA